MRNALVIAIMLICSSLYAEDPYNRLQRLIHANTPEVTTTERVGVKNLIKLRTPQSEVEDAIVFLSKLPQEDAQFFRFFSTYAVEPQYRENTVLALSFVVHSLVGMSNDPLAGNAGGYYPLAKRVNNRFESYRQVPGSATLWWIDLREYNWTPQAWEVISLGDGYFAEPIVQHVTSGALRLLSGNAVVRADWFIKHAMSSTDQLDLDGTDFYSTLLYARNTKPTTADQWRTIWGLDLQRARSLGNEFGTLVTKSQAVASRNRMLFGYRTEIGYLYETYDVKNQTGSRDYLENLFRNGRIGGPPDISDAGEMFSSNILGLQVYALRDAAGKLVEFGDPSVVRHMSDVIGDPRVRVAHSCMDCHASGPLPSENTLQEFVSVMGGLKTYEKRDALRLKRNLLSDRFKQSVADNQRAFARAVEHVNGLLPEENGRLYLQAVYRYAQPVTMEMAAFECGVTVEDFKIALSKDYRFGARLKLLLKTGEPIPRDIWEYPSRQGIPGSFQQAMIVLNGVTKIIEEEIVEQQVTVYQSTMSSRIMVGQKTLETIPANQYVLPTGKIQGNWLEVRTRSNKWGWIKMSDVKKMNMSRESVDKTFSKVDTGFLNQSKY